MNSSQWRAPLVAFLALVVVAGPALAQPKAGEKTLLPGAERKAVDKASPKLMTGKVTQVDPAARTFTVTAKGKPVTFSAAKVKSLPKVDEIVDITYTDTGGTGPLEAVNLNSSKSNIY